MSKETGQPAQWTNKLGQRLDWLLLGFSTYAVHLIIGLMTLLSLLVWQTQFPEATPKPLQIQAFQETTEAMDSARALVKLQGSPVTTWHETSRSETPVWFSFSVPSEVETELLIVEFPSRHATNIACWETQYLNPLGSADRQHASGNLAAAKAGFALTLSAELKNRRVLCRSSAIGPAHLSASLWKATDFNAAIQAYQRRSGLLDGGLVVLVLFMLITALVNRRRLYILFAAWLVINLRVAANSAGWDTQWLGNTVPQDWLLIMRPVTLSLYYMLSITLFRELFRNDLKQLGSPWVLRYLQWLGAPLVLLSVIAPYRMFLPVLWVCAGLAIVVLTYYLLRVLSKTHSRVAVWYSGSYCITILATFSEVLFAALGIQGLNGSVNFVTAAVSSSLLASLAIAEHMRHEHLHRLQVQAELKHTFDAMPIGLFTLDLRGRFLSANPALQAMLDSSVLTDQDSRWQHYFAEGAWSRLQQKVQDKTQVEMEIDGQPVPGGTAPQRFLVKAALAYDKIEGSLQDITEKFRTSEHLNFLANHDSLTKVLNRRGIEKALNEQLDQLSQDKALAVAYLDLDRFKLINDLFGHSTGNRVLQQVCRRVSEMLSPQIQLGRVGGDEFIIVFPETPIQLASAVCTGIIDCIGKSPFQVGDNAFNVRGSIGLIEVSIGMQFNDVMSTADHACRQAKAIQEGGGLVVYERQTDAFRQHDAELALIALLATEHATDGLYLEMQPIMSLTAPHDSLNFEVLLRMRDPQGQMVRTDHLIAAGESSGRMGMIDRWVLSNTLNWLNLNLEKFTHTKFVCMNLSGASLNDEAFLQEAYVMLEQNQHLAQLLCLEITEGVALHSLENTKRFVEKIQGFGARVALDDFGAGYTSFSYLKEFKADLLKIDGSFIVDMNRHPSNVSIVEAIVSMARNLGMKVIAEWAEDNATVQTLAEIGVDYVQGFAIARSMHPDKLLAADSSASFIQDDELARYMTLIERSSPTLPQVDLFTGMSPNLH